MPITDLGLLEEQAENRWDTGLRAFIQDGAGDNAAVAANRAAHRAWSLNARMLVDVSKVDTTTSVLGSSIAAPIMVAPSGLHTLVHPEGEVATAQGARDFGTVMVLSSGCGRTLPEVASVGGPLWFQLYWGSDRGRVREVVELAAASGCRALCLTADMPVRPLLGAAMRAGVASVGHAKPQYLMPRSAHLTPGVWDHDATLTWRDLDWLRGLTDMSLVVKGIMTGADALLAAAAGVDGVVVSNHGGRTLDTPLGTLDVLPEIVDALRNEGSRTEVYIDGGFRHGGEILTALAIGARAVLVGRPALWGLSADGADGVREVLELLQYQFEISMARVGACSVDQIDRSRIRTTPAWQMQR